MLGLTARYAQAWNTAWYGLPNERLRQRLAGMDAALTAAGRGPASMRRTVGMSVVDADRAVPDEDEVGGTVDDLAQALDAYERLGIDDLIVGLVPRDPRSLDRLLAACRARTG